MNRTNVKDWAYLLTKTVSLKILRKLTSENFIFPFYHLVADIPPLHIKNLYKVISVNQFKTDLEFLLKNYQPATKNNILNFIAEGKKSKKPFFFLSFDDGMRECFEIVYPILKQKGIEAAFFINPAFVDNKMLFFKHKISLIIEKLKETKKENLAQKILEILNIQEKNRTCMLHKICQLKYSESNKIKQIANILGIDFNSYLKETKPFMTLEQILEMQADGFIIGSHSYDHPKFWEIPKTEMQDQLIKSFDYLDKNIRPEIRSFAFPFSDINVSSSFFQFLQKEIKTEITFGTSGIKKDTQPKHIHRIAMEDELKNAERIIRTEYAYFCVKSIFGKNTIKRQWT